LEYDQQEPEPTAVNGYAESQGKINTLRPLVLTYAMLPVYKKMSRHASRTTRRSRILANWRHDAATAQIYGVENP